MEFIAKQLQNNTNTLITDKALNGKRNEKYNSCYKFVTKNLLSYRPTQGYRKLYLMHKGLKHCLEKMAFSLIEQAGWFYNTTLSNR